MECAPFAIVLSIALWMMTGYHFLAPDPFARHVINTKSSYTIDKDMESLKLFTCNDCDMRLKYSESSLANADQVMIEARKYHLYDTPEDVMDRLRFALSVRLERDRNTPLNLDGFSNNSYVLRVLSNSIAYLFSNYRRVDETCAVNTMRDLGLAITLENRHRLSKALDERAVLA